MSLDPRLPSPKEHPLFIVGVILSSLAWLGLMCGTLGLGLLYGAFILAFVLIAHALFLANIKGNGVRLSKTQLPELYERCQAAATRLGLPDVPDVYVVQSGGALNAFATKLFSRRFVILFSDLVDSCTDPRQLDFIIGHEIGHHAAGHLQWRGFLLPYSIFPLLGPAYSRAREYTCDRCGFAAANDLEQSKRGLAVLAAGGKLAAKIDLDSFMEQRKEAGDLWMAIYELVSSHPYLCKRVAALQELSAPGTAPAASRTAFAYVLAPIFGGSAGGAAGSFIIIVAVIGIIAAMAIPTFMKYQKLSREPIHPAMKYPDQDQDREPDEPPPDESDDSQGAATNR